MRGGATSRAALSAIAAASLSATLAAALAAPAAFAAPPIDTRESNPLLRDATAVQLDPAARQRFAEAAPRPRPQRISEKPVATGTPLGGVKTWIVPDETSGEYLPAEFTLRRVGERVEVWVQNDSNFPAGDCRNDGVRNVVTDEQVVAVTEKLDAQLKATGKPAPSRDGSKQADVGFGAPMWELLGGGDPAFYRGDGSKTVVLVANVRDENYYTPTAPEGEKFVGGVYAPLLDDAFDRAVITLDSYDWLHRTGANPPDETGGSVCSAAQPARPNAYEQVFAAEYERLLQRYANKKPIQQR